MKDWGAAEWLAVIGITGPVVLGVCAWAAKAIKHLGAIESLLTRLAAWMQTFGEQHVELRSRVDVLEKRVEKHAKKLFGTNSADGES
jgi:hypothetical protein